MVSRSLKAKVVSFFDLILLGISLRGSAKDKTHTFLLLLGLFLLFFSLAGRGGWAGSAI